MNIVNINSPIKLFWVFINLCRSNVIILCIIMILSGFIPVIDSILIGQITDTLENTENIIAENTSFYIISMAVVYGLWWESINITMRLYEYCYLKTIPKLKGLITDKLYGYIQYYNHIFFQENFTGFITDRIIEGGRSFEMILSIFIEKILRKLVMILCVLVVMYTINYKIAAIFLTWSIIFIGGSILFSNKMNQYSSYYARKKSKVSGQMVDRISNINIIRLFNSYQSERKTLNHFINEMVVSEQKFLKFLLKLYYVLGSSCSIMIFAIVYSIIQLRSGLLISIGDCVVILTLCISVVNDIWDITQELGELFYEFGAFNNTSSLILQNYSINDIKNAPDLIVSKGKIEFRNVSFKYSDRQIFNNKSITIEGKSKIGLVGFSGSGKTTFISLIYRLYDTIGGNIFIDEQDITQVKQSSLRDNISVIPQEAILFNRTIMENIRYGKPDATDAEVIQAAKLAYIDEFIVNLPDGYYTVCGERGNNLSGGQKQRVIIARAILKNSPILILDEATSSMDSSTEMMIQESLKHLMKGKTVIIIAHKLSTLLSMDKIYVFDNGRIVEEGTHHELLSKGEVYNNLWQTQIAGLVV